MDVRVSFLPILSSIVDRLLVSVAAYEFRGHDQDKKAPERDADREGKDAEVGRLGLIDDSSKKGRTNATELMTAMPTTAAAPVRIAVGDAPLLCFDEHAVVASELTNAQFLTSSESGSLG